MAVASGKITAVFRKGHLAGAAIAGLVNIPIDGVSYRLSNISTMDLTATGHTAGKVRVVGYQDRVCV